MKARFKFEIMNNLGTVLQDEEFKVAYFILNRLALEDTNRVKIYRAMLADLTGKSERTISRITDKLDEKGIIKKDTVSDSKNRYNYYSIHPNIEQQLTQNDNKLGHKEQETTPNLVIDDRFNKKEKIYNNKRNKEVKESKKVEVKKTFPKCEVEQSKSSTVEDVDCDWNTEFIRLEAKMRRSSTVDELNEHINTFSKKAKASKTLPSDFFERLEDTKELRDKLIWNIKTKKCYT